MWSQESGYCKNGPFCYFTCCRQYLNNNKFPSPCQPCYAAYPNKCGQIIWPWATTFWWMMFNQTFSFIFGNIKNFLRSICKKCIISHVVVAIATYRIMIQCEIVMQMEGQWKVVLFCRNGRSPSARSKVTKRNVQHLVYLIKCKRLPWKRKYLNMLKDAHWAWIGFEISTI